MIAAGSLVALAYLFCSPVRGPLAWWLLVPLCSALPWLVWPGAVGGGVADGARIGWRAGVVAVLLAVLGLAVIGLRRRQRARALARERAARVREVCDLLAADLAAGLPTGSALAAAVEVWPAWEAVAQSDRLGGSAAEAMRELAHQDGAGDLIQVAAAWQLSQRSGAALTAALAEVARGLADAEQTRRVVRSELASARATARLVAGLPIATLAMGSGMGDPVGFLVTTPLGWVCLFGGVALIVAGLAWLEQIAAHVEGEAA
ncbi:type II secretion system F family protein [Nocardioides sp. Bht2]